MIHVSDSTVTFTPGTVTLDQIEQVALQETIRVCHGRKKEAATRLGISRSALYAKLKRFGLLPATTPIGDTKPAA